MIADQVSSRDSAIFVAVRSAPSSFPLNFQHFRQGNSAECIKNRWWKRIASRREGLRAAYFQKRSPDMKSLNGVWRTAALVTIVATSTTIEDYAVP